MRPNNYAALFLILSIFLFNACPPAGAKNLLVNGGFDSTNPPFAGWKYNYETYDNSWWKDNHLFVALTNIPGAQNYALDLHADNFRLGNQGAFVDSYPVPMELNGKYRLTASARSTGCDARIMVEGYRWKPGIKPHPNPKLEELRKCYKFHVLNLRGGTPGIMSGVSKTWQRGSITFPEDKLAPLARENVNKVQFMVVHIIALGWDSSVPDDYFFYLYVDDVVLEQLN